MTQCERLLSYLELNGQIDPLEAWEQLGCYRLSARIKDLKNHGHNIITEHKTVLNRFNEGCRVALYRLVK